MMLAGGITYRVVIIVLNCLSIVMSMGVFLMVFKLKQLHERQGKIVSMALALETIFSALMLLSQFYTDNPTEQGAVFLINPIGSGCLVLGMIGITVSFCYVVVINIYSIDLLGLFKQHQQVVTNQRPFFVLGLSLLLSCLAFAEGGIGYNSLGICGLTIGMATCIVCLLILFASMIFLCLTGVIINKNRHSTGISIYGVPKNQIHDKITNQYINISILYLFTFILTRILPVCILLIIEQFRNNELILTEILIIIMSLGGILLSGLRAQDPVIKQLLLNQIQGQDTSTVQLEISMTPTDTNITIDEIIKQDKLEDSIGAQTLYSTMASNFQFRKTVMQTEFISAVQSQIDKNKIKSTALDLKLILVVIKQSLISQQQCENLNTISQYHTKHIRQCRYQVNETDFTINEYSEQADDIICTIYADQVFSQGFSLGTYIDSFDKDNNIQNIQQLYTNRNNNVIDTYTTCDSNITLEFINRTSKTYIARHFLKNYRDSHKDGLYHFLPILMGLYSIKISFNYSVVVIKCPFNNKSLSSQGFSIIACTTYQNGQIKIDMKNNIGDLQKRMQLKDKSQFMSQLNQNLTFLREQMMWGYSFTLLYLENDNNSQILPKMFRTKKGYIMATFGNLFDQFYIDMDNIQESQEIIMNPDYYAQQVALQIDKMI